MKLIIDFFLIGGILMSMLILFLLFRQKNRELPQNILLFFFGIIFFYILNAYADFNDLDILNFLTFIFDDVIAIMVGPIVFIYINSIFVNDYKLKKYYQHLIPSLFYVVLISIPILVSILSRNFIFDYLVIVNKYKELFFLFFTLYMLFYFTLSLYQFKKYKKAFKDNFSNLTDGDFRWIYHLLLGLIFIGFVDLLLTILEFNSFEIPLDTNLLLLLPVISLIFYLGYYGITQQRILLPSFLLEEQVQKPSNNLNKKATLNFTKTELLTIENNLNDLLKIDKPYLDENLTLQKLASALNISDKKLSTFLNQHLNISFYDLINKYRILAVKEKITSKEYDNITLLGAAFDSGFKSKTSFNRIFKKETGMSPSAYKNSIQ